MTQANNTRKDAINLDVKAVARSAKSIRKVRLPTLKVSTLPPPLMKLANV